MTVDAPHVPLIQLDRSRFPDGHLEKAWAIASRGSCSMSQLGHELSIDNKAAKAMMTYLVERGVLGQTRRAPDWPRVVEPSRVQLVDLGESSHRDAEAAGRADDSSAAHEATGGTPATRSALAVHQVSPKPEVSTDRNDQHTPSTLNGNTKDTETLSLDSITVDEELQARASLDDGAVEEYAQGMQAGVVFPPVVVFRDAGGTWLADGFHRFRAAQRAGLSIMRALVRAGGRRDAILHAVGANTGHGVRRTNADKRRAVTIVLSDKEWRSWNDSDIARACGVDAKTVRHRREAMFGSSEDAPRKVRRR
jgi:hypothetical protein